VVVSRWTAVPIKLNRGNGVAFATLPGMLPDVLAANLDVVFCGTAAGKRSAEVGMYYAGPGNRFWTDERWEKLRQAIHRTRPWEHATGPRTAAGKLRSVQNGLIIGASADPSRLSLPRATCACCSGRWPSCGGSSPVDANVVEGQRAPRRLCGGTPAGGMM